MYRELFLLRYFWTKPELLFMTRMTLYIIKYFELRCDFIFTSYETMCFAISCRNAKFSIF